MYVLPEWTYFNIHSFIHSLFPPKEIYNRTYIIHNTKQTSKTCIYRRNEYYIKNEQKALFHQLNLRPYLAPYNDIFASFSSCLDIRFRASDVKLFFLRAASPNLENNEFYCENYVDGGQKVNKYLDSAILITLMYNLCMTDSVVKKNCHFS